MSMTQIIAVLLIVALVVWIANDDDHDTSA